MNEIKITCDDQKFQSKPSGDEIRHINNRIARFVKVLGPKDVKRTAFNIGQEGCTFSPATFRNEKRNKENFEQQQLIALDFDNKDSDKKVSFK